MLLNRSILPFSVVCLLVLGACSDDDSQTNENNNNVNASGICGDGNLDTGEQCDDGAANSDSVPDACRTNCRQAHCGDWVLDASELCDSGPQNGISPNSCRANCTLNECGDGYLGDDEVCDDGNTLSDDGCRGDCLQDETLCGNGDLDPGEECDQGAQNSDSLPDACRLDCTNSRCGDDVQDSFEACDDGNVVNDLECSANCQNYCGDGVLNPHLGEECDRAHQNEVSPSDCRADCSLTVCGDGYLGGDEVCDDGDTDNGDGCSSSCAVEPRWTCSEMPSTCSCVDYHRGAHCSECIVYVDQAATGVPDGKTWATAFHRVQDGVDTAATAGPGCEVWVAQGFYTVFVSLPEDSLELRSGVALYGGFFGDETQRSDRDFGLYPTVISGRGGPLSEEVFHVITASEVTDATLDGFEVTHGWARGLSIHGTGGGMYLARSDLLIRNCNIHDNNGDTAGAGIFVFESTVTVEDSSVMWNANQAATSYGAGLYADRSVITLDHCWVVSNTLSGAGYGAEVYFRQSEVEVRTTVFDTVEPGSGGCIAGSEGSLVLTDSDISNHGGWMSTLYHTSGDSILVDNCYFHDNEGGAISASAGTLTVTDSLFFGNSGALYGGAIRTAGPVSISGSTFIENQADERGGAVSVQGEASITDCVFIENESGIEGGAIRVSPNATPPTISRSVFVGNTALEGGAIFLHATTARVTDCVFVGNDALYGGAAFVRYSPSSGHTVLSQCTFLGNTATSGGALFNHDLPPHQYSSTHLYNSIVWGNTPDGLGDNFGGGNRPLDIRGNLMQDAVWVGSYGNIGGDPLLVAGPSAPLYVGSFQNLGEDYFQRATLQSVLTDDGTTMIPGALVGMFIGRPDGSPPWAPIVSNTAHEIRVPGYWWQTNYAIFDLRPQPTSPVIDAVYGPEATQSDLLGQARVDIPTVDDAYDCAGAPDCISSADIGAYEYVP